VRIRTTTIRSACAAGLSCPWPSRFNMLYAFHYRRAHYDVCISAVFVSFSPNSFGVKDQRFSLCMAWWALKNQYSDKRFYIEVEGSA
jgi:hypothetical protein